MSPLLGSRCKVESANVGSRNFAHLRVDPRHLQQPAQRRQDGERAHRDLHRHGPLGDVVLGPREADVVVLDLAVGRVEGRLGVVEVALLELARLRARLAPEGAEDHPPGVDRGEDRADVAGDVEDPPAAAAGADLGQDLVLGEEAREGRDAGQGQAADDEARRR